MKTLSILFLIWLSTLPLLLSQIIEPEWKTTIYVEDAIGNKDSVIIGYTYGTNYTINPDYGESDTPHVLDSVLDVRNVIRKYWWGGDIFYPNDFYLSKINVKEDTHPRNHTPNGILCFDVLPRFNIAIYAKYPPVKISWDTLAWQHECHSGSWITTDALTETVVQWHLWKPFDYQCMAKENNVVWDFPTPNTYLDDIKASRWLSVFPTIDNRQDTMWIVQIATKRIDYFDTPCIEGNVGSDDFWWSGTKIYPNPSYDFILIESDFTLAAVHVFNIDGMKERVSYLDKDSKSKIDISHMSPGVKMIEIVNTQGQVHRTKFVKL